MTIDERHLAAPNTLDYRVSTDGPHVYIHADGKGVSPDAVDGFVAELIEAAKEARKNDAEGIASESGELD